MFVIHIITIPIVSFVLRPGFQAFPHQLRGQILFGIWCKSFLSPRMRIGSTIERGTRVGCSSSNRRLSGALSSGKGGPEADIVEGSDLNGFPHILLVISVVANAIWSDTYTNMTVVMTKLIDLHCVPGMTRRIPLVSPASHRWY